MGNLPVVYMASPNAWMTQVLFKDWFFEHFVPSVRFYATAKGLEPKALLLLDQCPAHPRQEYLQTRDGKIKAHYLPKNTTSQLQPMDQGIIRSFKANYRRELLLHLLLDPQYTSLVTSLKTYNIKDMCYIISKAWRQIKPESIEKCWIKGLGAAFDQQDERDMSTNIETDTIAELMNTASEHRLAGEYSEGTLQEWVSADDSLPTFQILSDDGIAALFAEIDSDGEDICIENKENVSPSSPPPTPVPVTATDAIKGLETALSFFESVQSCEVDEVKLLQIKGLIENCRRIKKNGERRRQTRITQFLK